MRNLLLLSNSTLSGQEPLQYAANEINVFLKRFAVNEVLFIPYALQDYDAYTNKMRIAMKKVGYDLQGIHSLGSPTEAVNHAQAIFIGGGNTFRLLKTLYETNLIKCIRDRIFLGGIPYIGSSAGTNVATVNICTTNDMPIVYPPTFEALRLVPFNINPHYLDQDPDSKHMGETREERITQYHEESSNSVVGLREGSMLLVDDKKITLLGNSAARIFKKHDKATEYPVGSDLSFLMDGIEYETLG